MKIKPLLHLLGLCAALWSTMAGARAQGLIRFNNNVAGVVRTPVFGKEGDPILHQ